MAKNMNSELHKKTYFHALEKMISSPTQMRIKSISQTQTKDLLESQNQAFEDVFKRPPSNLPKKDKKKKSIQVGVSTGYDLGSDQGSAKDGSNNGD